MLQCLICGKLIYIHTYMHKFLLFLTYNSRNFVKVQRLVDAVFKNTEGMAEIDAGELNIILQVLYATGNACMNLYIYLRCVACVYVCTYLSS